MVDINLFIRQYIFKSKHSSSCSMLYSSAIYSYGFMGDLMAESEGYRWMGPLRYEVIGAKMLAANRSYRARISYLPAEEHASPGHNYARACSFGCDVCMKPPPVVPSGAMMKKMQGVLGSGSRLSSIGSGGGGGVESGGSSPTTGTGGGVYSDCGTAAQQVENAGASSFTSTSTAATAATTTNNDSGGNGGVGGATDTNNNNNPAIHHHHHQYYHHHHHHISTVSVAKHSRFSLEHRSGDWITIEDDFAGIMMVIMPCRSDKSQHGVAKYGHLSDGNIHLVMVKKCSRFQYLRFLMKMSSTGLEAGKHHGGIVEVVPAVAVRIEPVCFIHDILTAVCVERESLLQYR